MDTQGTYNDDYNLRREEGSSQIASACLGEEQSGGMTIQNVFLTAPDKDIMSVLERLPVVREIPWRKAPDMVPPHIEERLQHRAAILLAERGLIAEKSCDVCARGSGIFSACVVLNKLFNGSCASCHYNSQGNLCSLRRSDDPCVLMELPTLSTGQEPRSEPGTVLGSPPVHNSPPAYSGKGVITFADFEPPQKVRTKRAAAASAAAAISHDLAEFAAMYKINKREESIKRRVTARANRKENQFDSFISAVPKSPQKESMTIEKPVEKYLHGSPEMKAVVDDVVDSMLNEASDDEHKASILDSTRSHIPSFDLNCRSTKDGHSCLPAQDTQSIPRKQIYQPPPEQPKSKMRLMIEEKARELKRKLELEREEEALVDQTKKLKEG